jgi:hypothetical protein
VGEIEVDFDRDVAVVAAAAVIPDRAEQVAGIADVLRRELDEDLPRVVLRLDQVARLIVASPAEIAIWKMVGFEVTPETASSRIRRASSPPQRSSRERKSIQTLWPWSVSWWSGVLIATV